MPKILLNRAYAVWKRVVPGNLSHKLRLVLEVLFGDWRLCAPSPLLGAAAAPGARRGVDDALKDLESRDGAVEKLHALLKGLAPEDRRYLEALAQRIMDFPRLEQGAAFAFNRFALMSEEERADNARWRSSQAGYRKEFRFAKGFFYSPEVFLYHNGLVKLPERAKAHIEGGDIMDLGAYVGDSALVFMKYKPRKIYSFDLSLGNIEAFNRSMRDNGVPSERAEVLRLCLGDRDGEALFQDAQGACTNVLRPGGSAVPCSTLDAFVEGRGLRRVGLIKADVEGMGLDVCRGMVKTLGSQRPVLSLAVYHNAEEFFEIKPFIEGLGLGYRFKFVKLCPSAILSETTLLAYPEELA